MLIQYELSAEYPHNRRNEWLLTLFRYVDNSLQIAVTTTSNDLLDAVINAVNWMRRAITEIENNNQLIYGDGGVTITYGDAVILP